MHRAHLLIICALLAAGCDLEIEAEIDTSDGFIEEQSAEAVGVLAFLNGPEADFELLDVDVGLDRRAATSIAQAVRGPDSSYGTDDDSRLSSIAELTALYWVGDAAIEKILDYVVARGGIPDLFVDGVYLTDAQATAILALANGATLVELDDDARLDARAARGIVDTRPLLDVFALADVPYVGRSALGKLLVYSESWEPLSSDALVRSILEENGITGIITDFPDDEVRAQADIEGNEVPFELAFRASVTSWLTDNYDGESPLEVVRDSGPFGPCLDPDTSTRLLCYLNLPDTSIRIIHRDASRDLDDSYPPEHGESIEENWAFYLYMPSLSDHLHWAITSRELDELGEVSVYNYGFN